VPFDHNCTLYLCHLTITVPATTSATTGASHESAILRHSIILTLENCLHIPAVLHHPRPSSSKLSHPYNTRLCTNTSKSLTSRCQTLRPPPFLRNQTTTHSLHCQQCFLSSVNPLCKVDIRIIIRAFH
jgi:hypothetical protein